jgi:DNA-binding MarR family transcriptional regulator
MSVLVARLEQRGLVQRSAYSGDGRIVLISITDDGRTALRRSSNAAPRYSWSVSAISKRPTVAPWPGPCRR